MTFWRNTTIKNKLQTEINNNTAITLATLHANSLNYKALNSKGLSSRLPFMFHSAYYKKRSFLCTAGITVEASFIFPFFLFVIISFMYIINIIYTQITLQNALEETVRNLSASSYVTCKLTGQEGDSDSLDLSDAGISLLSAAYIHSCFLTEENKSFLDNSPVKNGSKGVSFLSSSIDTDKGVANIVASYTVSIPFIPDNLISFNLSNHCYIHFYSGTPMDMELKPHEISVYFTANSKVYHFNRYCQYLIDYTEAVRLSEVKTFKTHCTHCMRGYSHKSKSFFDPIVYVTTNTVHSTPECKYICTSFIWDIPYSELDEHDKKFRLCKKCTEIK